MRTEVDQCIHFISYILRQSGEGSAAAGSQPNRMQRPLRHGFKQLPLAKFMTEPPKSNKLVCTCVVEVLIESKIRGNFAFCIISVHLLTKAVMNDFRTTPFQRCELSQEEC